jgi:hypothetical protein
LIVKVMMRGCVQPEAFFFFSSELPISVPRSMKDCLPSWRHSADTGANARRSKVIGRRIYDAKFAACCHICGAHASSATLQENRPPIEVHKF